jgi:virginiamycin A acetyltransferase
MKNTAKRAMRGAFLAMAFPAAAGCGFGRWETMFLLFAQGMALAPGVLGDYLRIAFYRMTLEGCGATSRISFGSFFAHAEARVGERVYIGPYCVLGRAAIGANTQIATAVQILSGRGQHVRDEAGRISGSEGGRFVTVKIGEDCWIGAAAIVMADVGAGSTIGAGSVVTKEIPAGSVAVGVPARTRSQEPGASSQ